MVGRILQERPAEGGVEARPGLRGRRRRRRTAPADRHAACATQGNP